MGRTVHVLFVAVALSTAALAQAPATPSERAQRDADKVFQIILMQSDKPRRPREDKPVAERGAAATPVRPARAAAPKSPVEPEAAAPAAALALPAPQAAEPKRDDAPLRDAAPEPVAERRDAVAEPASESTAADPEPAADQPLVLVRQVEPDFPAHLVRRLLRGTVQLKFAVLPDGSVGDVEVVRSSHARLNAAARDAVAQWRFRPIAHRQLGIVDLSFSLE